MNSKIKVKKKVATSEQKHLLDSLKKERDRAQQYLDIAGVILVAIDTKGQVSLINKKGCELLGYREVDIIGKNWFDNFLPQHSRDKVKAVFQDIAAGKIEAVEYVENAVLTAGGQEKIISWHNTTIRDKKGNIIETLSSGEDITERKRAEELLRESEERYRSIFENSDDAIMLTAPDGSIFKANPAACRMFGRSEAEIVQAGRKGVMDSTDPRLAAALEERKRTGKFRGELTFLRGDGKKFPGEITSIVFHDKDGQPRTSMIIRDITERKHAEEALKQSETKYSNLINKSNDGIIVIQDGLIKFANSKMLEMAGFSMNEILGKPFLNFVVSEWQELVADRYKKRMSGEKMPDNYEIEILSKDSSKIPVEVNASIIEYDGHPADMAIIRDITERKLAERALKEREEFLDSVIEQNPNPIWVSDERGTIIRMNQALRDLLKITDEEIVGKYNVLEDAQVQEQGFLPLVKSVFQEGKTIRFNLDYYTEKEKQVELAQETHKVLDIVISPIKDNDGKIIHAICHQNDISERKKAEEALAESEAKYRALVEDINEVLFSMDTKGNFTYVSPAIRKISRYNETEVTGQPFSRFIHPDDLPGLVEKFQHILTGQPGTHEFRVLDKDGRSVYVQTSNTPLFKNGQSIGITGVMTDITERKQAEAALRESEQRHRTLFETAADGILITDIETKKFLYANPAICKMLGYTEAELVGKTVLDIHPEALLKQVLSEFEAVSKGRKPSLAHDLPCLRKDGTIVYADANTSITFVDGKRCNVAFFTDVTNRKQMEEERNQGTEKLLNAMKATVEAIAMTVELRDPYTAGHQQRVTALACAIATEMEFPEEKHDGLRMAGTVHDIGKVYVPAEILAKPSALNELEYNMIKIHPEAGYNILKNVDFPWPIAQIVLQHHERMDGSGYPKGLSGEAIILEARILAVADVVESMASHRPYRPAQGIEKALEEITQNRGKLYDADVVDACIRLFTEKDFKFE